MKLIVEPTYDAVSRLAATHIIRLVQEQPDALLCLAAGTTPVGAYRYVVEAAKRGDVSMKRCRFVGLDEWVGLSSEQEGSCLKLLQDELFGPLYIRPSQFTFFDAQAADLEQECRRIDSYIEQQGGIDLALVGLGVNGHVGFNEPGASFDACSHVVQLDAVTKTVGQKYFPEHMTLDRGITLGIRQLLDAQEVLLLVNGAHKAEILRQLMDAEPNEALPASALKFHANSVLIADQEAASLVQNQG